MIHAENFELAAKESMINTLRIQNVALVTDLTLELEPGFNAVTGETGAGKSIIIGALKLLLGERADRSIIRAGAEGCSVEAVLDLNGLVGVVNEFLEQHRLDRGDDDHLVLKRTLAASGTNRQFINGSPTTLGVLARLGERLVDMHGPHDHQSLLHPAQQLRVLDAYGTLEPDRNRFGDLVRQLNDLEDRRRDLTADDRSIAQQVDLLRFQVGEIRRAKLVPGEEEELDAEFGRAANAARLMELSGEANALLGDQESSLLDQAGALGRHLRELRALDPAMETCVQLHQQAVDAWGELAAELGSYSDRIESDPERLETIEARLNLIKSLKRKYGGTVEEVIEHGNAAAVNLEKLEKRDEESARITVEIEKLRTQLWESGSRLSKKRRKLIPQLCKAVNQELADLGFQQSRLAIDLSGPGNAAELPDLPSASGLDDIEFQFAPNPGEPARPLRAIASSGEMSRVMLALKTVLAVQDEIPVLIFDEVDANVGGDTARVVGEKLRQIGERRQVISITHLAPVAAAAATHYLVEKQVKKGRTTSEIRRLNRADRVTELARMLGGSPRTASQHAEALLGSE